MRAFWIFAETLDLTVFRLLNTTDRLLGRKPLAERAARATEATPEPTPTPKWEK